MPELTEKLDFFEMKTNTNTYTIHKQDKHYMRLPTETRPQKLLARIQLRYPPYHKGYLFAYYTVMLGMRFTTHLHVGSNRYLELLPKS